jgi:hypothetical protein
MKEKTKQKKNQITKKIKNKKNKKIKINKQSNDRTSNSIK